MKLDIQQEDLLARSHCPSVQPQEQRLKPACVGKRGRGGYETGFTRRLENYQAPQTFGVLHSQLVEQHDQS